MPVLSSGIFLREIVHVCRMQTKEECQQDRNAAFQCWLMRGSKTTVLHTGRQNDAKQEAYQAITQQDMTLLTGHHAVPIRIS